MCKLIAILAFSIIPIAICVAQTAKNSSAPGNFLPTQQNPVLNKDTITLTPANQSNMGKFPSTISNSTTLQSPNTVAPENNISNMGKFPGKASNTTSNITPFPAEQTGQSNMGKFPSAQPVITEKKSAADEISISNTGTFNTNSKNNTRYKPKPAGASTSSMGSFKETGGYQPFTLKPLKPDARNYIACDRCNGKKTIEIKSTCDHCFNTGSVMCNICKGVGKETCGNCDGNGKEQCSKCGGSGKSTGKVLLNGISALMNSSMQSSDITCEKCDGKGYYTCKTCHGSGYEECNKCSGEGKLLCAVCKGTGVATKSITCPKCQGLGLMYKKQ